MEDKERAVADVPATSERIARFIESPKLDLRHMIIANDLEQLRLLKPWNYNAVVDFSAKRYSDPDKAGFVSIKMVLQHQSRQSSGNLIFYFDDCLSTRLTNILTMSGIEISIEKHRSDFFQEIGFLVTDTESDAFSFICGSFAAELADRSTNAA